MDTLEKYEGCKLFEKDGGEFIGLIGEDAGFNGLQVGDVVSTGKFGEFKNIIVKLGENYTAYGWGHDKL